MIYLIRKRFDSHTTLVQRVREERDALARDARILPVLNLGFA